MEVFLRKQAIETINSDFIKIKNKPQSLKSKIFGANKKVTVVMATYNAEDFITKSIESVVNQSLGFKNIQLIVVDDCSTDHTPEIIEEYANKYKNICFVALDKNSGSPGLPRNIGIELANTKYITFLDADDWLDKSGIEALYNILEDSDDDYVVGKTIKVESKGNSVIGEYASVKERRNISPFSIPHFFYHMGPTARMMKLSLLNDHDIRFPEMKFGEDKLFFIDVFVFAKSVATTVAPIYYVNRTNENESSLTRVTNVLDKRKADLKVIDHVKSLKLAVEKEKVILNRIYEYDVLRTFDSILFVKSDEKNKFLDILRSMIDTTQELRYDFKQVMKNPLFRTAITLFEEGREDDFIQLFKWLKTDKNKKHVIKNERAYYEVPFLTDENRFIEMPILAQALDSYVLNNKYTQIFEIYGEEISKVNTVIIRDRVSYKNEIQCDVQIQGNIGQFQVDIKELEGLDNSLFTVFIRYNEYQLINIKRINQNQLAHNDRKYSFYTSVANNLSLSIKPEK